MGRMRVSILRPRTSTSASYRVMSRMYLVVLVVVLSSTGKCDPPHDQNYRVSTQNDVTAQTTIYPPFWSTDNRKFSQTTQTTAESASETIASFPNAYNTMKKISTPSTSLKSSINIDSGKSGIPHGKSHYKC